MKRSIIMLSAAVAVFVGLALPAPEAEAKRLGGGGSVGMKRNITPNQPAVAPKPATPAQQAAPAAAGAPAAAAAGAAGKRNWLGPIAGLAAGIGLMALLSHFGMGEGVANFLMIALLAMAAFFVFRLLFRKAAPQGGMQYAGAGAGTNRNEPMRFDASEVGAGGTAASAAGTPETAGAIPAGFDTEGFLRQAKLNFIRLQAANDRGDMEDIKSFTMPEVFAEVQMQYEERGRTPQFTDVVQLDASLLEVLEEGGQHVASVHFHGLLREQEGAEAMPFGEVWHLAKPLAGGAGWRIAGIQQLS